MGGEISDFATDVQLFLESASDLLLSETAYFVYRWLAVIAFLFLCVLAARPIRHLLDNFQEEKLIEKRRGRKSRKPDSIKKDIDSLKAMARDRIRLLGFAALGLTAAGLIGPGIVIGLIITFQNAFLPGPPLLATAGVPAGLDILSTIDIVLFVLDQGLRGFLGDSFEVFGLSLAAVENNTDHLVFSSFVFFYRLAAQLIFVSLSGVALRILWGRWNLRRTINALENDLKLAQASA